MAKKGKIASVLAFEKKLVPSDGFLYGTIWENREEQKRPLKITTKSVRGTISNRLPKKLENDPAKLNTKIEDPNLQIVDNCSLNSEEDTVNLHFSLKILGGVGVPSACNDADFAESLAAMVQDYTQREGFRELGKRYAINIANGRFLWRNRVGSEKLEVVVKAPALHKTWTFAASEIPIRDFDFSSEDVDSLGNAIADVLASDDSMLLLDIDAYAKIGEAQEVYPSEELVLGKQKSDKSKILYQIYDQAGLHSQKIGNAIRTIDTWYPDHDELLVGPIAIEPYGAVTTLGRAFRAQSHFYSLFDKFALGEKLANIEDEHYVMGILVRGGVFGESSKE